MHAHILDQEYVHAGDWITAFPSGPLTTFSPRQYRLAVAIRYGHDIFPEPIRCGDCEAPISRKGSHCINCMRCGLTTRRHNKIRDRLGYWAKEAGFNVVLEKKGMLENNRVPADILIMSYRDGVDWGFDVTVKSPLSLGIRKEAAVRVLAAADRGVALKYDSYHGEHENRSFKFQPLGLEALGGMHPIVLRLIRTFAKRIGG